MNIYRIWSIGSKIAAGFVIFLISNFVLMIMVSLLFVTLILLMSILPIPQINEFVECLDYTKLYRWFIFFDVIVSTFVAIVIVRHADD